MGENVREMGRERGGEDGREGKSRREERKGRKSRTERRGEERENRIEGKRDGLCGETVDPAAAAESV